MIQKALLLVDLQNDFCRGGSLSVPGGDEVIAVANQIQSQFDHIILSQDWHPKDHLSFASNHPGKKVGEMISLQGIPQILWPDHCVQGTKGAELHPALKLNRVDHIVYKGTEREIDSYSAFFDNGKLRSTGLFEYLQNKNIQTLYIMGLATDYCVKFSCLDALSLGLNVFVIQEGCRGVDLQSGDSKKALEEMAERSAKIISLDQI